MKSVVTCSLLLFTFCLISFHKVEGLPVEFMPAGFPADSGNVPHRSRYDTIRQFNQFGSYGLFINGIHAAVQTEKYNLSAGYNYKNFDGYRVHSNAYAHTLNLMLETTPSVNTRLQIVGNYFNGQENQPGSLTKSEFGQDPFQADPRAVNRNEKRITSKGTLDINYRVAFGKALNQRIEISGSGGIEYFERSTREFKITTRYTMGLNATYVYNDRFWHRNSEFSAGAGVFHQPERKEEYENFSGQKSDWLEQIETEKTSLASCFISEIFELVENKLFVSLTGRYHHVIYKVAEEMAPSLSDTKRYGAFTPEVVLNYKIIPAIALFASYDQNFRNPTDKELESPDPSSLYNHELQPQTSTTLKAGIKGAFTREQPARFFLSLHFDAFIFKATLDHEIVPYEVFGDVYYRNASRTNRYGVDAESRLEFIKGLLFSVHYSYAHYIYGSYTATCIETDSTGNIVGIFRDFAGKSEPDIPRNNLDLSLYYEHALGKKAGIFAKVSSLYGGGLWVDDANTDRTNVYNLVNAMLGFDLRFRHFTLSATGGVNNLFDQVYAGYTNTNSADKRFYNAGAPRNFFGSVNFGYIF